MAGAGGNRDFDAAAGAAHDVAGHGDVALVLAGADADAGGGRVLDDVAGDGGIGLDGDADAGGIGPALRPLRCQAADQVALDDGEPAAVVEVGADDAERGASLAANSAARAMIGRKKMARTSSIRTVRGRRRSVMGETLT